MEENRKINKRPRSITEFKSSYSDSKNYSNSKDKHFRRQTLVKYILIAIFLAVVALGGFLITDALLNISEEPYVPQVTEESAENEKTTAVDKSIMKNQVTVKADRVEEQTQEDVRE